jgi:predicted transcriptional regulator of viral defense system
MKYMRYIEFRSLLKDFIVFSLTDIKTFDPDFHRRRLNEWQEKGYIKKIIRGYYIFSDIEISDSVLFLIANSIYSPSYISLEMGLSYYHLIPESVYSVTSVTSNKTSSFSTDIATYSYQSLKPELLFGTTLVPFQNHQIVIGEIEKVILDYFYLNPNLNSKEKIEELRINSEMLLAQLNQDKLLQYMELFNNQALEGRISQLLNIIKHA